MNINFKIGKIEKETSEVIVLWHFQDEQTLIDETALVDKALRGCIRKSLRSKEFQGKVNQHLLIHTLDGLPSQRVLVMGLGKKRDFSLDRMRNAGGLTARCIRNLSIKEMRVVLPFRSLKQSVREVSQAFVEGCILGLYQFNLHRTENRKDIQKINEMTLVFPNRTWMKQASQGAQDGQIIAQAASFTRDLVNHPSNVVTPTRLSEEARSIAKQFGLQIQILNRANAEKLGMGSFLGVAQGSQEPPRFIILEYRGRRSPKEPIVLVGKSVTFDSGGISLKPGDRMEQMKGDMAGGAAVLGIFKAVAGLKLPISLVGILPATENMPSGTAIKPGDVLRSLSGKTIEVINTDAEGPLILADALTFADRYNPTMIIDLATLTGAVVVALGHHATGVMGNSPKLIQGLKEAGKQSGERVWELPMWDEYSNQIKSDVADVKNVGGRAAGTITAAAFLRKFVGDHAWAHLDIAGTSWVDEDRPISTRGATGIGVRLLTQFLSTYRPPTPAKPSRSKGQNRRRSR